MIWAVSITMINMAVKLPEKGGLDTALAINTIRVAAVAVFLPASAPITDREFGFLKIHRKTLAALVFGGIVALALGWFLLTYSFLYTSESQAVPISSTTPLFATASGIIFLHERIIAKNVAGSIMVVVGVLLIFVV
jgi:drug/metabolite transporter (DMT)-like permease